MHSKTETSTTEQTRVCKYCLDTYPVTFFRRRAYGKGREHRCRTCRNQYERDMRTWQRQEKDDAVITAFVLEAKEALDDKRSSGCVAG